MLNNSSTILARCGIIASTVIFLALLSQSSFAGAIFSYDFTTPQGNQGHAYTVDGFLTVTAWGSINIDHNSIAYFDGPGTNTAFDSGDSDGESSTGLGCTDNKNSGSCANTILSGNKKKNGTDNSPASEGVGLGVQEPNGTGGSSGISGKGREKNEQIVFEFASPVLASSIVVGLTGIDFGSGLGNKDDLIIYLDLTMGGFLKYDSVDHTSGICVGGGGSSAGFACDLTFLSLPGLSGISITRFAIRAVGEATGAHPEFRISTLGGETSDVPEPTTLVLMFLGLVGLGLNRRKRLRQS